MPFASHPLWSKPSLRKQFIARRKAISTQDLAAHSQAIANHIERCDWFQAAQTVYAYRSFRQEITLQWLYDRHPQSHRWGFPRCVGHEMVWHQWTGQADSDFSISALGIEEPQECWPTLDIPDLILVPTVACDRRGYRLGYGGGYYDRMLEKLQGLEHRTIGIVMEDFLIDALPIEPWDQPLDAICTENGLCIIRPPLSGQDY